MPRPPRPRLLHLLLLVCLIALSLLPGCAVGEWLTEPGGAEPVREALAVAEDESAQLDQVIADIEAELAALPEGEERNELVELLADAKAGKAKADAVVADLRGRLAEADSGLDVVAAGLQSAGPLVPPPFGLYLGLAGTVLAGFAEYLRRRTRRAAQDVVISIEHTKASNAGTIDFDDPAMKSELRSRMSTDARKLVESAQAKAGPIFVGAPMIPIPVETDLVSRDAA